MFTLIIHRRIKELIINNSVMDIVVYAEDRKYNLYKPQTFIDILDYKIGVKSYEDGITYDMTYNISGDINNFYNNFKNQ